MAGEAIQLDYARKDRAQPRFLHIFLLPLLWLPAGIGSRVYYGDEYIGFMMANVPAIPLMLVLKQMSFAKLSVVVIIFDSLLMLGLGYLMDRVRVRLRAYLFLLVLAAIMILTGMCIPGNIPPITPPPGAQFYPQSLCPAWAAALYIFAPGAIFITYFSHTKPQNY